MTATPAIEGWFTTGDQPTLIGSVCTSCDTIFFPKIVVAEGSTGYCRNPACVGTEFNDTELSRTGRIWSYTDAQYQPPAPYLTDGEYQPFALAAVELPEGLTVLGQLATGVGVTDVKVGDEVELVVETLNTDETGERTIWKWRPIESSEGRVSDRGLANDEKAAH